MQGEQIPQSVHCRVHLGALLALGPIVAAPRAALRGRTQGARVEYGGRRLGCPALRKAQEYAQIVDHLHEDACFEPPLRLLVDCLPRRQVVGHIAPGEPVRTTHLSPLKTSLRSCSRWGASSGTSARYGATNAHSSSETSLGYCFRVSIPRCYRSRPKVHNTLYASADRVFWVVDNGSSHRGQASVKRLEGKWPNLKLVHLPVHASWLNQIEIYFSVIERKVLTPNDLADLDVLAERLLAFQERYEQVAEPFAWKFTRHDLGRLLDRLAQRQALLYSSTAA